MSTILLQWKSNHNRDKYAQIKHYLQVKTDWNISKQLCWWILMGEDLSLEEAALWIIDWYFSKCSILQWYDVLNPII